MQVKEMISKIYATDPELAIRIGNGFRGLFDPSASEWNHWTAEERLAAIKKLITDFGISLNELRDAFRGALEAHGYHNPAYADECFLHAVELVLTGRTL